MEFIIGLIFVGIPVLIMLALVGYILNKILNAEQGITKADYPVVMVNGKMRKAHPNSFAARQARKKGLL